MRRLASTFASLCAVLALAACGGGGDDLPGESAAAAQPAALAEGARAGSVRCDLLALPADCHRVGGRVTGLNKAGLILGNRGTRVEVSESAGSFVFPASWPRGSAYAVSIVRQPSWQHCRIRQARGTVRAADVDSVRVDCVDQRAAVTTLADTQGPSIAIDAADNLYYAASDSILQRSPAGATRPVPNTAPYAYFTVDRDGAVYVAGVFALFRFSPGGDISTVAVAQQGILFDDPTGIAVGPGGDVFVAEFSRDRISKVSPQGAVSVLTANLFRPVGLAVDTKGNSYVSDFAFSHVVKVSATGERSLLAGCDRFGSADDGTGAAACFWFPEGLAVDAAGNVYVADTQNRRIRMITPRGVVTTLAGNGAPVPIDGVGAAAGFAYPTGIAVDRAGRLFVTDAGRVRQLAPAAD